jgi:DNA-binding NtrC family response regulator
MTPCASLSVALVDDDPFYSSLIAQHLSNLGISNIQAYSNGYELMANLTIGYDLIFLDHEMPEIAGVEVLLKIKRYDPDIFVIFLSGQKDLKVAVNALKYGAFDYILKEDNYLERIEMTLVKVHEVRQLLSRQRTGPQKRIGLFF